jgi:hypothetical protein
MARRRTGVRLTSVSGPPADGVLEVLPFNSSGAIHSVVPTVGLMSSGLRSLIADADISKGDTSLTSPADGTSRSVDESWFKGWLTGLNELLCLALVDCRSGSDSDANESARRVGLPSAFAAPRSALLMHVMMTDVPKSATLMVMSWATSRLKDLVGWNG